MTTVQIRKDGTKTIIEMTGHAGNTRVCAACSTLGYTLLNTLIVAGCRVEHTENAGTGYMRIEVDGESEHYLYMYIIGMMTLEESYPDHVKVEKSQKKRNV